MTVDAQGNLILRPTFFELSVVHRGTTLGHHMTGSYALSIAAVLRAQVRCAMPCLAACACAARPTANAW